VHALCRTGSITALLYAWHSPLAAVLAAQMGRPARSACRHSLARSIYRRKPILHLLSSTSLQLRMHAAGTVDSACRSMRTCEPACGAGPAAPALRAQRPRSTRAWLHTDAKEASVAACVMLRPGCMGDPIWGPDHHPPSWLHTGHLLLLVAQSLVRDHFPARPVAGDRAATLAKAGLPGKLLGNGAQGGGERTASGRPAGDLRPCSRIFISVSRCITRLAGTAVATSTASRGRQGACSHKVK